MSDFGTLDIRKPKRAEAAPSYYHASRLARKLIKIKIGKKLNFQKEKIREFFWVLCEVKIEKFFSIRVPHTRIFLQVLDNGTFLVRGKRSAFNSRTQRNITQ